MEPRQSVQSLGEMITSLLGLKAHLTSNWVKSVQDIIKSLPSEKSSDGIKSKKEDANSETSISKTKEELASLTAYINQLNIQRRQVLNELLDLKGNIRVFCRIRPIRIGENFGRLRPVVPSDSSTVLLKLNDNKSKSYSFDKLFHPGSSQDEVFSEVEPVIKSVLDGYNACIFAYGQTGTGKTFTMEGTPDSPGIVPRAIEALFKQAAESNHAFLINFSMLEVYLGNLKDLLVTHPTKPTDPMPPCLSIHTDPKGGVEIDNLVAIQVSDFNQALRLYRFGCRFRSTASTNSNSTSSRSHCMIRISMTCFDAPERRRETNKVWLIDLGGSERVLKTKAWGRRLQEGKAINLSLSALGDVINALQRRKQHIPYRNSKLTQVLKDSLGEDSKTLMLVHVSPKEEDLCETICSLNFATRAKSIHLGHDDPQEIRDGKEALIKNLQQKMKNIEDKRQRVRGEIEKLNTTIENLTRPTTSTEEQLGASYSSIDQDPMSNLGVKNNGSGDVKAASSSKLPRFMRATVSSKTKSGANPLISEGKDQVVRRRRRPSYQRAESITLPVKNNSEYKSEHSISRSSCLAGLNMKSSADIETEYSQDTLEYESKMVTVLEKSKSERKGKVVTFLEKSKSKRTQAHQSGPSIKKSRSQNSTKFSKVQEWLLHKNEQATSGYSQGNKRVQAIPILKKRQQGSGSSEAKYFCQNKASKFPTENIVNRGQTEKQIEIKGDEMPISEVIIDKPLTTLKELFDNESRSDDSSQSLVIQTQDFSDESSAEEDASETLSLPDYNEDDDDDADADADLVKGETQSLDIMLQNGEYRFSPSHSDCTSNYSKGGSGVFDSILELGSSNQIVPIDTSMDNDNKEELDDSSQFSLVLTKTSPLELKSQRALFTENANQKDLSAQHDILQGSTQIKGMSYGLNGKVEMLSAAALLGLGFYDLGFDNDFFQGLMC